MKRFEEICPYESYKSFPNETHTLREGSFLCKDVEQKNKMKLVYTYTYPCAKQRVHTSILNKNLIPEIHKLPIITIFRYTQPQQLPHEQENLLEGNLPPNP